MDIRVVFDNYQTRTLRGLPDDCPIVLTKDGWLRISKPGVYSGKHDIVTFNNVIAYYDTSITVEKDEKPHQDWVDPGSNPLPETTQRGHLWFGTPTGRQPELPF